MDVSFKKIDLYMQKHILPMFHPERIHWVFSLSGGKDSFIMCNGIKQWYERNGYSLSASGLHIWQWGHNNIQKELQNKLPWLNEIHVLDGRMCTEDMLKNKVDQQAPCRSCSDIRRCLSDDFLKKLDPGCPIILCRGLHFTDMAISILWRLAWYGPKAELEDKGKPLVHLFSQVYLSKPLCYFREYECQTIAEKYQYISIACDCPNNKYPGRRDIIEESLRHYYTSSLWEFDIPGTEIYLQKTLAINDVSVLKEISLPGHEKKRNLIPEEFYDFVCKYYKESLDRKLSESRRGCIENGIDELLSKGMYATDCDERMGCKLLLGYDELTDFDKRMIATMGPFWGAIAVPKQLQRSYYQIQRDICGLELDIRWKQVYYLLKKYYNEPVTG